MHSLGFIPHFTPGFAIPTETEADEFAAKKAKQLLTEAGKIPHQVICK